MKIGNFTLLDEYTLLALVRFSTTHVLLMPDNGELLKKSRRLGDLMEYLEIHSMSSDERQILLTGGLTLLVETGTPSTEDDHILRERVLKTIISNKSVADLITIHLHDRSTAKWECILSFNLFMQDPKNYQTFSQRKINFARQISEKYQTDIYGRPEKSLENKAAWVLSFFPACTQEIIGDINSLKIALDSFHPYWDIRESFEWFRRYPLGLTDYNSLLILNDFTKKFAMLDQAIIPEHDRSLIATGCLISLQDLLSSSHIIPHERVQQFTFHIYIKNTPLHIWRGSARDAALDSFKTFFSDPENYSIYSSRVSQSIASMVP